MSTQLKPNCLQTIQTLVFRRALHPELFELRGRSVIRHGDYELESWTMDGSHVLRFEHRGFCCCELVLDQPRQLPDVGLVDAFFCAGDRDFEHKFDRDGVNYLTSVQTEQLSENLYASTYEELTDFGVQSGALMNRWDDGSGPSLSMLDTQRYAKEIHAQSYHMMARGGIVLRTQSIFELL